MTNPYTHLRTLIDDESRHEKLSWLFAMMLKNNEYDVVNAVMLNTAGFIGTPYTTSLDALIPLWPEGWDWCVEKFAYKYYMATAYLYVDTSEVDYRISYESQKQTPALAMLDCLLQVLEYEHDRKENQC